MSVKSEVKDLKLLLDEQYQWPSPYTYKFIVPNGKIDELKKIVGEAKLSERASRKGTYISLTVTKTMKSSDDVLDLYSKVSKVEGVVSL